MLKRTRQLSALMALVFLSVAASAGAATFTVGNVNDTQRGVQCTAPSAGTCSLRELIEYENGLPASTGGDTIHLPANLYSLVNGQLMITHSVTLNGGGPRTTEIFQETPVSTGTSRVFDLQICPPSNAGCPAGTPLPVVSISGIGVFFGKADSTTGFVGGNIRNQDNLTLSDDVVAYGTTTNGSGAGISNDGGTLTVTHSLVESNGSAATNDSGGIQNFGPGPTSGAAGQLIVDNSTIYGNTSAQGGGIMSWCGGSGGACSTDGSSLKTTIVNSTVAGNDGGGRVATGGGVLAAQGTITLHNTILANNTVDNPTAGTSNNCGVNAGATLTSLGHNLAFPGTECPLSASGDLQNTDPMFISGAPQDLGGLTDLIALHAGSPAVDAVPTSASGCVATDQRHLARPQGAGCDIGAFELYEPVEGQSFSTLVGTVGAKSGTTPSIAWGDGTTSGATYDSSHHVTGTHTYGEEGNYSGTILYSNSDGFPSTAPFDLRVQDAPLTGAQSPITAIAGSGFTGQLATFTDAGPGGTASDYTATVAWGDGASSPGTVSATAGGFAVRGTHTYTAKGNYNLTVAISDAGGASTQVGETANVGTVPVLVEGAPTVVSSTTAGFSGSVNPNGLTTTAHFEYKLDPSLGGPSGATSYDQSTPTQTVGSDSTNHPVSATVTGLVPNALYHVRLVASNSAGTSFGADRTFTTAKNPPPPPPVLGQTANVTPVSGLVLIKPPPGKTLHAIRAATPGLVKGAGFVPLTQARQIPDSSQIDARAGTLNVVVANGQRRHTQKATLTGSVFSLSQNRTGLAKGLTTFNLLEGAFPGAPTYNSCNAHPAAHGLAHTAASKPPNHTILQTLHATDNHGRFRTRGRYSAGTVRGTKWDTIDRCDGTLTIVHRGTVNVLDLTRRKTITVHAGHSYLARARRGK